MQRPQKVKLVVGLGNPGPDYKNTYHNIGAVAVGSFMPSGSEPREEKTFSYRFGENAVFVLPKTFMNESGRAVADAAKKFKVPTRNILVVHDDSDIKTGKYKLSCGRNSAGHKGVESIINRLGTKSFWRLRIGIRPQAPPARTGEPRPARRGGKAGEFVTTKINKTDAIILKETLKQISEEINRFSSS